MVNVRVRPQPKKRAVWLPLEKKRPPPPLPATSAHRPAPQLAGSPRARCSALGEGSASVTAAQVGAGPVTAAQVGTDASASSSSCQHHAAPPVPATADVASQQTQTTEFLRFFEEQRLEARAIMRGDLKGVDDDIQARLLADRQILHGLLHHPHRRPASRPHQMQHNNRQQPPGTRRHMIEALSAGYSSSQKYEFASHESLLRMCNSYDEEMYSLRQMVARMAERCDKVDLYEAKMEKAQRLAEIERASHQAEMTTHAASHARQLSEIRDAHSVEMASRDAQAREQAAAVARERLEARDAHAAAVAAIESTHAAEVARLNGHIRDAVKEAAVVRATLDKTTRMSEALAASKRATEDELATCAKKVRALMGIVLRMSRVIGESVEATRMLRAAGAIQRYFQARQKKRHDAARVLQAAQRNAIQREATRAAAEAARLREQTLALERKLAHTRLLAEQMGKAASVAAQLDAAKMAEQDQLMRDKEEAAARAKHASNRLTTRLGEEGVEVPLREGVVRMFGTDFVKAHVAEYVRSSGGGAGGKYANDVSTLLLGDPSAAALGLLNELRVDMFELFGLLAKGVDAIIEEVANSGTDVDRECLDYILHHRAGSSPTLFSNSAHPRDCDENGLRADRTASDGLGMQLADFVNHPSSRMADLREVHVVAIRLYSTAAFRSLNNPLRDRTRTTAHPFAATIFFLADGIKKLRTVEADREKDRADARAKASSSSSDATESHDTAIDLWRGMKNLKSAREFLTQGGSEFSLMSTSSELQVAVGYALSPHSLLLKIRTPSFMQRGADISFLSAFPAEREFLYPPLTFLKPTGRSEVVNITPHTWGGGGGTVKFSVIEVEPQMA